MEYKSNNHNWDSIRKLERENQLEFEKVWQSTIDEIEGLPAKFGDVIEDKMKNKPKQVRVRKNEKCTYYEYRFMLNGFECELDWWKPKMGQYADKEKAQYVVWDPHTTAARCYVRNLKELQA